MEQWKELKKLIICYLLVFFLPRSLVPPPPPPPPPQQHLAVSMNVVEVAMRRVAVGPSWHCIWPALKGNLITLRRVYEASYMPSGTPRGVGRRVNCEQNYDWRSFWMPWSVWPALGTFELKAFCLLQYMHTQFAQTALNISYDSQINSSYFRNCFKILIFVMTSCFAVT